MADTKKLKGFQPGYTPWNKGKSRSYHSKGRLGMPHLQETKDKIGAANSIALQGNIPWNKGLKGYLAGEKHYNWKGGTGTERHRLMQQLDYKNWRSAVFERDKYTCRNCKKSGVYIEANHIKPWALYPEMRYEVSNGETLCKPCHMQTETYAKNLRRDN